MMVEVEITISERDARIRAVGHADFNPGNDIVCAAISVLVQTAAYYAMTNDFIVIHKCETDPGDFDLQISCDPRATGLEMNARIRMIVDGVRMVEECYPEYVRLVANIGKISALPPTHGVHDKTEKNCYDCDNDAQERL